jgi:hypothetical protein
MLAVLPKCTLYYLASFLNFRGVIALRVCCGEFLFIFDVDDPIWENVRPTTLNDSTRLASAAGLQFLNRLYSLTATDVGKSLIGPASALGAAATTNDIPKIMWLARRFVYTVSAIAEAAECAARCGMLDAIKLITHTYNVTQVDSLRYTFFARLLHMALRGGHIDVVDWLIQLAKPYLCVASPDIIGTFRVACQGPSLTCLVRLATEFRMTRDIIRAHERYFLGDACSAGRTGSARWLVTQFMLRDADMRLSGYMSIRRACDGGHFRLASMVADIAGIPSQSLYIHLPRLDVDRLWPYLKNLGIADTSCPWLLKNAQTV